CAARPPTPAGASSAPPAGTRPGRSWGSGRERPPCRSVLARNGTEAVPYTPRRPPSVLLDLPGHVVEDEPLDGEPAEQVGEEGADDAQPHLRPQRGDEAVPGLLVDVLVDHQAVEDVDAGQDEDAEDADDARQEPEEAVAARDVAHLAGAEPLAGDDVVAAVPAEDG